MSFLVFNSFAFERYTTMKGLFKNFIPINIPKDPFEVHQHLVKLFHPCFLLASFSSCVASGPSIHLVNFAKTIICIGVKIEKMFFFTSLTIKQ